MRHLPLIIISALYLLSASAFGQSSMAKQHYMAGDSYYQQGRYDKAIGEFEEAYRLDPRPKILLNISMAYERKGDLQKTVDYLNRYIKAAKDKDEVETLKYKVQNLERRIASTGIEVTSNQEGAAIYVNDVKVASTPVTDVIPLKPGAHVVKVVKPGYQDFVMNVAISWGVSFPVQANLTPGTSGGAPVAPVDDAQPSDAEEDESFVGEVDTSDGRFMKVFPWVLTGVGAATSIVGFAVFGTMALQDDDPDKALVSDIMGFGGAAIAVGGLVWGIITVTRGKDESVASTKDNRLLVTPVVNDETVAISATLRF